MDVMFLPFLQIQIKINVYITFLSFDVIDCFALLDSILV